MIYAGKILIGQYVACINAFRSGRFEVRRNRRVIEDLLKNDITTTR